jgi:hypothetical protein
MAKIVLERKRITVIHCFKNKYYYVCFFFLAGKILFLGKNKF